MSAFSEIIYGINPVRECLRARRRKVRRVFRSRRKESAAYREIIRLAAERGVAIQYVDGSRINKISGAGNHQDIAAEVEPFPYTDLDELLEAKGREPSIVLALDGIVDPHNLGAILRTAAVCEVQGVLIPKRRSSSINATVTKVSAGAVEFLRVCRVTNMAKALDRLKEAGFWIVGIDEKAELPLFCFKWDADAVVIIGGEHKGIRPLIKAKCDVQLCIPAKGSIRTLNASVAGGMVLYELMRQKMPK